MTLKKIVFLLMIVSFTFSAQAQKYETRGVWLTTNYNLDWPTSRYDSESKQKADLILILDKLQEANFNTVFLQTRTHGTLIYPSTIEPWAKSIANYNNPGWDPLRFAIDECHKRGLEIHAWMVTYKVYSGTTKPSATTPNHVWNAQPDLIKPYVEGTSTTQWLDPGNPGSKTFLLSLLDELATNYPDLNGIQFDYIRYPESNAYFNDDDTWATYGVGTDRVAWRRDNINQFVYAAYDKIKSISPSMKLGSAPIGIYKSTAAFSGWEGYTSLSQDSRDWMEKGKHDYVCPQIYWNMASNPQFNLVAADWADNSHGKHVYTGINVYGVNPTKKTSSKQEKPEEHRVIFPEYNTKGANNWSALEIQNQVNSARSNNAEGQCFYRTETIIDNVKSIRTILQGNEYLYPAIVPPMAWKDAINPNAPTNLQITKNSETSYTLNWDAPTVASDGDQANYYMVYASAEASIDISNSANIIKCKVSDNTYELTSVPVGDYYICVTALDEGNNESTVSNTVQIEGNTTTYTLIDDFETDEGHFYYEPFYSGSTTGIDASSTSAQINSLGYQSTGSLQITLIDNAGSTDNWSVRMLSGGGDPANNVSLPNNGKIQLWLMTQSAPTGAEIFLWIDDNTYKATSKKSINNDGNYHLYEWDLETDISLVNQNVTLDAIFLTAPNASSNWTLNIDNIAHSLGGVSTFITSEIKENFLIKAYPTQVEDWFNLEINALNSEQLNLTIFNLSGKIIKTESLEITSGKSIHSINIENLNTGMYILRINNRSINKNFKIIKK